MEDIKLAYCEVDMILGQMEEKYVNKVPSELRKLFKEQKRDDYSPKIRVDIPLDEQKLLRKTIAILAMLNLNYWCEDENEKQDLIQMYAENDRKREEELREKYNPDNLFKKKDIQVEETTENAECKELIEYKEENFLKRILRKIVSFFKKQAI